MQVSQTKCKYYLVITSSSSGDDDDDRFIPLIRWYVSEAVYWYFTRQSFGYINCFVTDSFYIE